MTRRPVLLTLDRNASSCSRKIRSQLSRIVRRYISTVYLSMMPILFQMLSDDTSSGVVNFRSERVFVLSQNQIPAFTNRPQVHQHRVFIDDADIVPNAQR